ncbi:MAG: hypothetical protein OIN85_00860 [Candidatus Methanoperedens sp.]|nr:hypothetical protein [Candidatus Methanoperedens sp.]
MRKELLISAKFDTADFDKSVESMQKKLRELYAPSDAIRMQQTSQRLAASGFGPLSGAPGAADVSSKMNEYKRNLDKFIREEKTALEGKVKNLTQQETSYKKITEQYQKIIGIGKEDLKLKEQVKDAQEALIKAKEVELESEIKINALLKEKARLGVLPRLAAGYQAGGLRGAAQAGGEMMGMSAMGAASLAGVALIAAKLAKDLAQDWVKRPMAVIEAQGAAMGGTIGKTLGQMQSGEFTFEGMFGEERGRARGKAESGVTRQKIADIFSLGIFTERGRAAIFDPEKYNAMNAQLQAENFNAALGAEKEMSPFKKDAIERLQKNIFKDIAAQRQMGLSDKEMFGSGGFLQNAINSGFLEDMAREASKGIAASGGSTAMQRSAVTALQAERGLNLTNATQLLGGLSGAMGSAGASKQSLIDIFATAQQIGLDKSKYAEENRKFMQNVTDIVQRGGMTAPEGAQRISEQMGGFAVGTNTIRGIENARAAYEAYSQATTATAGYTGAINAATMMRQFPDLIKSIGKDPALMQELMSLAPEELDPNSPFIQSLLKSYNRDNPEQQKTSNQLIDRIQQMHISASSRYAPGLSDEPKKLAMQMVDWLKKGKNLTEFVPTGEAEEGFAPYAARLKMVPQYQSLGRQALERLVMGQAMQETEMLPGIDQYRKQIEEARKKFQEDAKKDLETKETGRDLDKLISTSAEQAGVSLRTLAKDIDRLTESAVQFQARMSHQEPLARAAAEIQGRTISTEAADAARKIQQNIAVGRDPYKGLSLFERVEYEVEAERQPHATTGGK